MESHPHRRSLIQFDSMSTREMGNQLTFCENENGTMEITPIKSLEELKMQSATVEEFRIIYNKSRQEELDLEF